MKRICILLGYCGLFTACGPNTQEKARLDLIQLKHDDSIRASATNDVMLKVRAREDSLAFIKREEELKQNAQKIHDDSIKNMVQTNELRKESLIKMQAQYDRLQEVLVNDNSKLAVLMDKQKRDAEFHFGRLPNVRDQNLKNDQLEINNVKEEMNKINSKMEELKTNCKNLSSLIINL